MASGCPVACSNASSIPEVVGSAAELFDPDDVEAIEQALLRVCFDNTRRAELIAAGTERIGHVLLGPMRPVTVEAYRVLLRGGPGSPKHDDTPALRGPHEAMPSGSTASLARRCTGCSA